MAYTFNPITGQLEWQAEDEPVSEARRGMLARQADEGLSDYDKFVQTKAGGVGLPPNQIAPNPDGTGNYLLTFKPGDSGYDSLMQSGQAQPDASGNITVPSNIFQGLTGSGRTSMWQVLRNPVAFAAFVASAGAAGAAAGGGAAAGDAAGLAAMGADAGLSGAALDSFVASGGTMGSTAAGGAGVGLGDAGYTGGSGGGGSGGQMDWTYDPNTGDVSNFSDVGTGSNPYNVDPNTGDVTTGTGGTDYPMPNPGDPVPTNPAGLPPTGGSGGGGGGGTSPTSGGFTIPGTDITIPANVLSGLIQGAGGYLAADKTTDALRDIYNTQRADRAPSLAAYHSALNAPDTWYQSAPATGATDAVLRRLSVNGNPIGNPGDLAKAAAYNLGGYNNYLSTMGNLGLGGQATQAQLGTNMANSLGSGYEAIGAGARTAIGGNTSPMDEYYRILTEQARRSQGGTTSLT